MLNATVLLTLTLATHDIGYPGAVVSGDDPDFTAVPSPAATVERVGVPALFSRACGHSVTDEAPVLRLVGEIETTNGPHFQYELRYTFADYEPQPGEPEPPLVCPSAVLPPASFLIDVGLLPEGSHRFQTMGLYDGEVVETYSKTVRVGTLPSTGVSGPWYAPEQSGRGLFVARISGQGNEATPLIALYWATHDAQGQPVWVLAPATADGLVAEAEAFNTAGAALAPGDAQLESSRWGVLRFEYTGCGSAVLTWDADDPAITDGSVELEQLAELDGLASCSIQRFRHHPKPAVRE
ncbi:MAG TPA: hypothetical protein VMQ83_07490 [Gammaproteobacteria bacterium]|nr:hypothetical protein [Gammaproteobacteria bacterium]